METHTFNDFDAFARTVRDVDCTMLLQNATSRSWVINHAYLPGVHVQLGRLGSGNIVEGQSWSSGYLLYLPLTDTDVCTYSANGTVLEKDSFFILEPGCEFCVSTKFAHDWCTILVPTRLLVRGSNPAEPLSGSEKAICRVTPPNRQLANQFRALVHQVMTTAAQYPQFESSPAATSAVADLLAVASMVVGSRQTDKSGQLGRAKLQRQELILSSKEWLEERDREPVLIGDLAAAANVSERTLRRAFHEYFGVGPARYLQLRQLHQVHRVLRTAEPEAVSVADVLLQHGVWEFSRFAARYRRLFGELPSETLRAKRR